MLGDLESAVVGEVQNSHEGIRTHRLKRRLIDGGLRCDLDRISDELLSAQRNGLLKFPSRLWQTPFLSVPEPEAEADLVIDSFSPDNRQPINRTLKAIPATVLNNHSARTVSADSLQDTPENSASWPVFKKLCDHYIECLRLGAASRASHAADRHTSQFHILKLTSRWWPDSAGPRAIRIARSDLGGEFLEGLSKRSRDPVLIGYPLSVSYLPTEDLYLVVPMGILQCEISLDDSALTLTPNATAPILNPDWVRYHQRRKDLRSALRQLAELTERDANELSFKGREGWSDVFQMSQMAHSFAPDQIANRLNPAITSGGLHLGTIDKLQNCVGLFLISENNYTKGAQADLRSLKLLETSELAQTALASIFTETCPAAAPVPVAAPFDLSEDQYLAVRDGLRQKVTVVSGPPGTGKSQVVSSILVSALMSGKTALFSSHAHKAIDAVQERVDELLPNRSVLMRVGGDTADGRVDFKSAIHALVATIRDASDFDGLSLERQTIEAANRRIDKIIALSDAVAGLTEDLGACWREKQTRDLRAADPTNDSVVTLTALPRTSWWARLLQWLAHIYRDRHQTASTYSEAVGSKTIATMSEAALADRIADLVAEHRNAVAEMESHTLSADLPAALSEIKSVMAKAYPKAIDKLSETTPDHRHRLSELQGAIGLATARADQRAVWEDYADVITKHFPIWSGTALGIPSRVPLVRGLFDYVIIDEATTCNLAQAIPLLARARHVIIVGDKMQTGMISDLDPGREREMLADIGLSSSTYARFAFSQVSLFDLAASLPGAKRHILRDHFRCDPDIADYISDTFYGGNLLIRTDTAGLRPPKNVRSGLHWTNIEGPIAGAGRGCRSESEAHAIAEHVADLIKRQAYTGSIGIVTPFKQQATLIAAEIERKVSYEERERCRLAVGTAHRFQGSSRDLILVSMCYGPDMPRGSQWFLGNSTDWLNVAVSRARAVCNIFGNRYACESSSIRHIAKLAKRAGRSADQTPPMQPVFESPWERALFEALKKAGITPITQYPLAGRRLDMAILVGDLKLDIEVDGDAYHRDRDGFRKVSDHWRDHVVQSLGWRVQRFWVYELKEDMEGCVERIKQSIGNR